MAFPSRIVAALVLAGLLLTATACGTPMPEATPTASVENPQRLTEEQADDLAAMRFRNNAAGIVGINGQVFAEAGDLGIRGWVDFAARAGYVRVTAAGAPSFLVIWDDAHVAFRDVTDDGDEPPLDVPEQGWQTVAFQAEASELTRLLAALLLLSDDRPENPQLIRQNGAMYLGEDLVDGEVLAHYSGVAADASDDAALDLSTQYWLDSEGMLVRFGIRLSGAQLSVVNLLRSDDAPVALPEVDSLVG